MFLNVYQNLGRRKLALLDQRDEMGHIDILGADVRTGFGSVAAVDALITEQRFQALSVGRFAGIHQPPAIQHVKHYRKRQAPLQGGEQRLAEDAHLGVIHGRIFQTLQGEHVQEAKADQGDTCQAMQPADDIRQTANAPVMGNQRQFKQHPA